MKINLEVLIELQVTEEANQVGSNEKVVWAVFGGQIPTPAIPRVGENIWLGFIDDSCKQAATIKNVEYGLSEDGVLVPKVFCEYALPVGDEELLEERVLKETAMLEKTITPWFKSRHFKVLRPSSYSQRTAW